MAELDFKATVGSLLAGMDGFLSTKTVVGDPIELGDSIILPLMEVTFGMGAGTGRKEKKQSVTGGIGGKMSPTAMIVIGPNGIRVVNVKYQDAVTKIIDLVPELADKFTQKNVVDEISDEVKKEKSREKAEGEQA